MCSVWEAKTKTTQEVSKMTTELQEETRTISKIVMGWKEGTGSIGISAEGCDPYFKIAAVASIDELLPLLHEALVEAQARWSEGEQHPEYKRPTPPAPERAARATTTRQAAAPKPDQSPKLF